MLSPGNLGQIRIMGSGTLGSETTKALLASSQQEGSCGQEARGPPGKQGLGAQGQVPVPSLESPLLCWADQALDLELNCP